MHRSLLRPGRLEEHICLPLPELRERVALFMHYLSLVSLSTQCSVEGLAQDLAAVTHEFSPAEIKHIVTEAAVSASRLHLKEFVQSGKDSSELTRCALDRKDFRILDDMT